MTQNLLDKITSWIIDYATDNGKQSLVYGCSGGINSSLIHYICSRQTKLKIIPIYFNNINQYTKNNIVPDNTEVFFQDLHIPQEQDFSLPIDMTNFVYSHFSSVLSSIAAKNNGIVIGCLDRNRERLVRYYQKNTIADIYPTANLFRKEVENLLVETNQKNIVEMNAERSNWHEEKIGLSWDDIEWADKQNEKSKLITNDSLPDKSKNWYSYVLKQKTIITKMHQVEKKTRHKMLNRPVLKIER